MEVSAISSVMALPCEGHLSTMFHMFSFLKRNHNGVAALNPTKPEICLNQFPTVDWSTTPCIPCRDDVPSNAPTPVGVGFTTIAFVDSDHSSDSVSRLSRNGFIVRRNSTSILFCSKK